MEDYGILSTGLLTAVVGLILLYYLWLTAASYSILPIPGPRWRLPIFGHLHLLRGKPYLALTAMQKVYGDVFKIRLGPRTAIVISGKETIKDFCASSSLNGRPHKLFNSWTRHDRYFAFGHSPACLRYRKATMKAVGSFPKSQLEEAVREAVDELAPFLCAAKGGLTHTKQIRASVADVSYFMCFGEKRKSRSDEEFRRVMTSLENILAFVKQASIADLFPWALYLPFIKQKYDLFTQAQDDLMKLIRNQERRHNCRRDASGDAGGDDDNRANKDLCDLLSSSVPADELQELMKDDPTIGTLSAQTGMLLVAGYETVAVSLCWVILLLASHPEVQEIIYEDLAAEQMSQLLEGFMLETLRFSMASPMAMPHMTLEPTVIRGYTIPKETLVLVNLWSGSRDSRVWGPDADQFKPERFISCNTGHVDSLLTDQLVAFGSGRRRCVGEQLAKSEIRLFTASLIQRFKISLANENEPIDYWPVSENDRNLPPVVDLKFTRRFV